MMFCTSNSYRRTISVFPKITFGVEEDFGFNVSQSYVLKCKVFADMHMDLMDFLQNFKVDVTKVY